MIAHDAPLVKPYLSDKFDYEGELVIGLGKEGRHISLGVLEHVAGYTIFNEGSLREYQFKDSQWTMGKKV